MAGYKKDSPNKFVGLGTLVKNAGTLAKGIKNRDEYGGGLKGAIKGVAGEFTGGTEKNRNEEINTKLDTIIAAVSGGGDEAMAADTMSTSPAAAPLSMASPAKFKEFMKTAQQSPVSNNTGGKKSTFDPVMADRMMAVADPETNTKDLLFMLGGKSATKMTGPDDKLVKVTDEGVKAGNVKIQPYGETKGTDQITGYKKNKAGVKVNLANLPVNLKVGFEQKNKGYKSSISPSVVIGGKIKLKGKKQEKPKFT